MTIIKNKANNTAMQLMANIKPKAVFCIYTYTVYILSADNQNYMFTHIILLELLHYHL